MLLTPDAGFLSNYFAEESNFRTLFPLHLQKMDALHWSPLPVIGKAVQFLVQDEVVSVLDIGSGIGKFCLAGAFYRPAAHYYGVEQREQLVTQAAIVRGRLGLNNVHFIHGNFTQLDLKQYDHFYFYNSFFENLSTSDRIDDSIAYSRELYNYYSHYLYNQLEEKPAGTRIVTYCSWGDEIPNGYKLIESHFDSLLKCWIKERQL
ncbi:methyltransferase domain-containing protein [Paraflavitalea sp. CAU 1676]|uniref:methyltransferase domain-containing protein n=1 Tax=Paraflavitalea sp. CAU 1676 TaxID=3032598 RepID=UPI0023DC4004|nr:methyltransferase domain-containing protein [Paraflavitalea sp. CAU 1676]MDF2191294.1 methyltransferase domain-containing protein [Paraflavitalea sp. CAU 1676]